MHIACSTFSYHDAFAKGIVDIAGVIKEIANAGCEAIELNDGYVLNDPISLAEIKKLSVSYGLDISAVAIENNFCREDFAQIENEKKKILKWLDKAYFLGAPILRVNTGQIHDDPSKIKNKDVTRKMVMSWTVQTFKEVIEEAKRKGIIIALENHFAITKTSSDTSYIVKQVDSDWLKVNIDTGNFWADPTVPTNLFEDPYEGIEKLAPYMVYCHAKVWSFTLEGEKYLDYDRILKIFHYYNYKGYLSIEYFGKEDPLSGIPKAVSMLKKKIENPK